MVSATGTYPRSSSSLSFAVRRWAQTLTPTVTRKASTVTANDASTRAAMVLRVRGGLAPGRRFPPAVNPGSGPST